MALERSRTFAELLRTYRRAAQMTQEKLAERAGLSVRALRKLESGASVAPRRDTIDLLAAALKLPDENRSLLEASASHQRFPALATPSLPGTVGTQAVNPAAMPLVGRPSELALLERHLAGKEAPLLALAGEPGIGKTRLLQETILRARGHGLTVLQGGCHRRSGQEPYAPLLAALATSLRSQSSAQVRRNLESCTWLVRLLPELAETSLVPAPSWTLPPAQERRLMFAAVSRYLANIARPSGTLLVLDDLQWAGQDALDLLAALLRTPQEPASGQLRVVAAYRSTEVRPGDPLGMLLADLAREGLVAPVELGPLTPTAADVLATALLADRDGWLTGDQDKVMHQLVERTGGVPYFLVSCAQALRYKTYDDEGSAALGESGTRIDGGQLPWTVTQSIRQRLALQPEATRDLLNVVAVSGRESPIAVLLAVAAWTGQDQTETMAALDVACQAGLLVEEQESKGYAFAHDLIREVVVADVGAARIATLHGWVGEAILQATPHERHAAELAWHFARSVDSSRALPYAVQAGEQAEAAYAHSEAERHYRMALELARELGDQRREAEVLEQLADVLWGTAHVEESLALLEAAAELHQGAGNLDRFAFDIGHMTRPYTVSGHGDIALARLRTLLTFLVEQPGALPVDARDAGTRDSRLEPEVLKERVSPAVLAQSSTPSEPLDDLAARAVPLLSERTASRVYLSLAVCLLGQSRDWEAVPLAECAVRYAQAAGDHFLEVRAHVFLVEALIRTGQPDKALATLETAYLVAQEAKDLEGLWLVEGNQGYILFDQGNFTKGMRFTQRALEAAEQYGMPDNLAKGFCGLGMISFYLGDWDQALAFYQRSDDIVRTLDFASVSAEIALHRGRIYLARGETQLTQKCLAEAIQTSWTGDMSEILVQAMAQTALAESDLLHADAAAALARLEPWLDRASPYEQEITGLIPLVAWACRELGKEERAAALLDGFLAQARERHYHVLLADGLRVAALLALRQGHWQEVVVALDEALALARQMPYPYAEAKALYVFGDLHAARGEPERAREQYVAALAVLDRLGERLYAEQVKRALAAVSPP